MPRTGGAARTRPAAPPPPTDPVELLSTSLAGSGLTAAALLRRAGIRLGWYDVRDLLFHLPRRYDDLRELSHLGDLVWAEEGTVVSARVRVEDVRVEASWRRRVQRTIARLRDDTGQIDATWFGRRFIERRLRVGQEIVVSGRLKRFGRALTIDNPEFQAIEGAGDVLHAGRIVPVYRLTAGLTAARLRLAIREALDRAGDHYPEYLPGDLRNDEGLEPIAAALESAHYPETFEGRDAALRRLAFDELLALQVGMVGRRRARGRDRAPRIEVDDATDVRIRAGLVTTIGRRVGSAIALTADQEAAIGDVRADLAGSIPMLRLLQGDVGSGKTAVAAYALAAAAIGGFQAALLAPTDLLARQHRDTVGALLEPAGVDVLLLTGSLNARDRSHANDLIASGQASVIVGTHALFSESVSFARLGLAIVDEQHRFGVEQRSQLEAKAGGDVTPHVLLMTATPIPRTLGQVLYADLDVSDLRTPPSGRIAIRTGIRTPDRLEPTWAKVRDEAAAGHRTFVVVPLIEEGSEGIDDGSASGAVAAETEAQRLGLMLAPLRVGLVHGRMKPAERDAEMSRFRDGDLEVLVGTTVIEVGVDVPEATMMIIENADRFGLAQLHQLRGRVGRGTAESFCVLVSDATDETAVARLKAAAELTDGFELAERDFELRREGDVLGYVQSGLPGLRVASLTRIDHRELAVRARSAAERLLDAEGALDAGRPELEPLARELRTGWLRHLATADPASGS
ncbi:MAG TPA: ATP-dependent DNA helicase RecG [Candidatus Limnocylindrales bacterium]|jgi:ATP-dependent DNA helicase RecG|nr:ATP-dependent DNA helicase RecG [Candidatus Limnocylindrales bacterium]